MKPAEASTHSAPDGKLPRGRRIRRDLLKGLCFMALVLVIKTAIEYTTFGHWLERMGYDYLQHRLSSEDVPVYIVDISDLKPEQFNLEGKTGVATPRNKLQQLIKAIAAEE